MATKPQVMDPLVQRVAVEHLVNARHAVDNVLILLDRAINLPGMPRREVSLLKEQRTKLNATVGVLAGCRARVEGIETTA